jgi:hypothetical protein
VSSDVAYNHMVEPIFSVIHLDGPVGVLIDFSWMFL